MAGWALVLIATPIGLWTVEAGIFPFLASLGVLAQLGATISALSLEWSSRRILATAAAVFVITWIVEFIGVTSGIPFGRYNYSLALQPQTGGVPALIPLAWFMMLAPAWGGRPGYPGPPAKAAEGLVLAPLRRPLRGSFTAWDLYLDPQMVAREMWAWVHTGGVTYFGIPCATTSAGG